MSLRFPALTGTTSAPSNTLATGTITAVAGSALIDGETFTIQNYRGVKVTFEFDSNSSVTAGNKAVAFTGADNSTTVAAAIAAAIVSVTSLGLGSANVGATVTNTALLPGPEWNAGVTEAVANGTFAVTDVTGGAFAGLSLEGHAAGTAGYWLKPWDWGEIAVKGTGTGASVFQGIIWLYDILADVWAPAGMSATVADRGKLNDGTSITGTNGVVHTQPIGALSAYARIFFQATTFTNLTSAVVTLTPRRV